MIELDAHLGGFCAECDLEHVGIGAVHRKPSSLAWEWGPGARKARVLVLTSMTGSFIGPHKRWLFPPKWRDELTLKSETPAIAGGRSIFATNSSMAGSNN
jgi:hypothetical protein